MHRRDARASKRRSLAAVPVVGSWLLREGADDVGISTRGEADNVWIICLFKAGTLICSS